MTSQSSDMTSSSIFFDIVVFLLLSLVTGRGFMSVSWLILEYNNLPEIRKSEIPRLNFPQYLVTGVS